ncbi:MAG: 1-deoxy-D-xylulose-5-phosphate synthase [Planctomycetaceae bacterium]|jgi:1-deoxy-D-xylulose-5-phosphate synthase|nr:1-deoxy-D-xylulose-5-phosphate synthase [Planctomycetaceae bacterium]
MEHPILSKLQSPLELHEMSVADLDQTAAEICDVMCDLLSERSAHFASNLGVVELCLALHSIFDFCQDRLIWDTGHQIYPHKLITGRYQQFKSIRTKQGLMGYPNPAESDYDLFMTGHAGASVSTAQGLHSGDVLSGNADRKSVAVIGDGAFPSGIVYEAMNNADGNLLVVLNDNEMSICPRVGGVASYLDRLRNSIYPTLKAGVQKVLGRVPVVGDPAERFLAQMKEAVKAGFHGGMLFEELGFQYFGPIDGHDIGLMRKYLKMAKGIHKPVLIHVVTQKGHGFKPAEEDPRTFHAPPVFERVEGKAVFQQQNAVDSKLLNYTSHAREAILDQMSRNERVTCLTAAMCQGNKLEPVRDTYPDRFFDVGICEGHAVAFAGGQCKAGARPVVAIYSTFLQRSYDHIFQEVCLQDLPVTFMLDRAGLAGPDGPTHHGVFDLGYLRVFPNISIMAPADEHDMQAMLEFSLQHDSATAIRYPKGASPELNRDPAPVEFGKSEVLSIGKDGTILALGAMVEPSLKAAAKLKEDGLDVGVVNVRFVKPLDEHVISDVLRNSPFVVTVEEAALIGGFGSAVLEFAAERRLNTSHICRLGIPDIFVEHGERRELLSDLGLDSEGVYRACRDMAQDTVNMETV